MPRCKNCPDKYYTGKEPSPRGIGYHASAEEVGSERIGKNNKVWHVETFGRTKKTKRWVLGTTNHSKFVHLGQVLRLPPRPLGMGLQYHGTNPYSPTSWCPYGYAVVDQGICITANDMGLPLRPMLISDFMQLYKKHHKLDGIECIDQT